MTCSHFQCYKYTNSAINILLTFEKFHPGKVLPSFVLLASCFARCKIFPCNHSCPPKSDGKLN